MSYHPIGQALDMSKVLAQQTAPQPVTRAPTVSFAPTSPIIPTGPQRTPGQWLGPAPLPAIPACLDAGWQAALTYCETYPASNGPDAGANAICTAARAQPAWYGQVKSTPTCQAEQPPPPPKKDEEPPEKEEGEPNYMLWGGLALLLVAAGGLYYYSKKKG